MDKTLDLLMAQSTLYKIKGWLPVVSHLLNGPEPDPERVADRLLNVTMLLQDCGATLMELEVPEDEPDGPLWRKVSALYLVVGAEYESVQLQLARWWLAAGYPQPRPECLANFLPDDPLLEWERG